MANETTITVVGNLVDNPQFRFTAAGHAVVRFRVASTPRYQDRQTGEWKDGDSLFLTCTAWRELGEHIAESLQRGMRIIVQGRLRQRTYETEPGDKRTIYELEAEEIGPSLRFATATVTKVKHTQSSQVPTQHPWPAAADSLVTAVTADPEPGAS